MSRTIKSIGLVLVLLVGILLGLSIYSQSNLAKALGGLIRSGSNVPTGTFKMLTNVSTTTPVRMTNGTGTTTLTVESENLDTITIYMLVKADTNNVSSWLDIKPQASDDNIDWFDYDPTVKNPAILHSATTSTSLASTTHSYTYRPSTRGATTTKAFELDLKPARYTRLVFTVATSTTVTVVDIFDVWASIVGKINNNVR